MIIKPPFYIGSRLLPTLRVANVQIAVAGWETDRPKFHVDFDDGTEIVEQYAVSPPSGGFQNPVDAFCAFLEFLVEVTTVEDDEDVSLFDEMLIEWAAWHSGPIHTAYYSIHTNNGVPKRCLIETP